MSEGGPWLPLIFGVILFFFGKSSFNRYRSGETGVGVALGVILGPVMMLFGILAFIIGLVVLFS